jgi:hypothetical protein
MLNISACLWVICALIAAPASAQRPVQFEFRGHHLGDPPWEGMRRPVACDPVFGSPNEVIWTARMWGPR